MVYANTPVSALPISSITLKSSVVPPTNVSVNTPADTLDVLAATATTLPSVVCAQPLIANSPVAEIP